MAFKEKQFDRREIFDITPKISPRLAVFPGDTPFSREILMDMKKGDHLALSTIRTTVHLGAHADAPHHYSLEGEGIETRSLRPYLGPCQVLHLPCRRGERLRVKDLAGIEIETPRVLMKTLSFPDPERWNSDFMSLSAELVEFLADKGVKLVGIDTPSIDLAEDQILESHQAVARRDLSILEGIVLNHVPPGVYDLVALPLPLEGADASPVRAILLK